MIVLAFTPEEFSTLTLALQVYLNHCQAFRQSYKGASDGAASALAEIYERREAIVAQMQETVLKARAS